MIINLKNEFLSVSIDSIGAELISLKDKNQVEYIWQRDEKYWKSSSPILFPQIGNARNDKTIIYGKEYVLLKHGFCRNIEFEVKKNTETEVEFFMQETDRTLEVYPFLFELCLIYKLNKDRLQIEYRVKNKDKKEMLYLIGAHPGFRCPIYENEDFEDYIIRFEMIEDAYSTVYDLDKKEFDTSNRIHILNNSDIIELSHDLFKKDAIYLDELKSRKVSIINKSSNKGVMVDFNSFDTVAFWTAMPDAPFICVEPWNGSAIRCDENDEFINRYKIQKLSAGKEANYQITISVL